MKHENVFSHVLHDHGGLSNFSIIYFKLSNFPCDLHVLLLAYIRKKKNLYAYFAAQRTTSLKQVIWDSEIYALGRSKNLRSSN